MRRRKLVRDEKDMENHERWLVSYADFITLLFAFFVVMYAISSVNEGKYRALSESLDLAFSRQHFLDPIKVDDIPHSLNVIKVDPDRGTQAGVALAPDEPDGENEHLQLLSEQIKEILSPYIDEDLIEVKREKFWVEIEMKSAVLFASGEASLSEAALPILNKISEILRQIPNPVYVEGYTDNIPIDTMEFPSNWELSAGRAASVVHEFSRHGVNPERMAAIGYGEHHPVADNRLEEGRYKNRRIVLVLLARSIARHQMMSDERASLLTAAEVEAARKRRPLKTGEDSSR